MNSMFENFLYFARKKNEEKEKEQTIGHYVDRYKLAELSPNKSSEQYSDIMKSMYDNQVFPPIVDGYYI